MARGDGKETSRRALLIANASYDDGFDPLPCTHVDIAQLKTVLEHPSIGPYDVETAVDLPAFDLKHRIESFLTELAPGDLALLYLSGHGDRLRTTTGEFLFLARDTKANRNLRRDTAVSATFLDEQLCACRAERKVVILDACFSGGFSLGFRTRDLKSAAPPAEALLRSRGCYVISSSALDQVSYGGAALASGGYDASRFTGHLVEVLRTGQADRDGDGQISVDELFDEVSDRMRRNGGAAQTPVKSSVSVSGRIVVAKRVSGPALDLGTLAPDLVELQRPTTPVAPSLHARAPAWPALLEYYRRCLEEAQNAFPLLTSEDHEAKYMCAAGPERIIVGEVEPDGCIVLADDDPSLDFLSRSEAASTVLYYGYPAVVLRDEGESRKPPQFAPLLIQKLRVEGKRLRRDGKVVLHPTLTRILEGRLSPAASKRLRSFRPRWEGGHHSDARREIMWLLREVIQLDAALDTTALSPQLDLGAPTTRACNAAIFFVEHSSPATQKVIKDMVDITNHHAEIAETALAGLLRANCDSASSPAPTWSECTPLAFNDAQLSVLRSAMTQRMTVTKGPPGTGKSQLVANVVATCIVSEQRVLLATTNNRAVDVVCERLNGIEADAIIRTGNEKARIEERTQLARLIGPPKANRPRTTTASVVQDAEAEREKLEIVQQALRRVALREQELLSALRRSSASEAELSRCWNLAEEDVRSLLRRRDVLRWRHIILAARFGWLGAVLLLLFLRLPLRRRSQAWPAFTDWVDAQHVVTSRRQALMHEPSDEQLAERLSAAERAVQDSAASLLAHTVRESAQRGRDEIKALLKMEDTDWRELGAVLQTVRAWAVTALSARRFPLRVSYEEMQQPPFDLVIIDEASQCHIADVLPLLFRAKRALIIGDPMQLGPIGRLTSSQAARARSASQLTAAWLDDGCLTSHKYSAFDAAQRALGRSPYLLDEHYRCHPEIADFANQHFYSGELITLSPGSPEFSPQDRAIAWLDVIGRPERRGSSWVNTAEAQAIRSAVQRLLSEFPNATVGIVSPLRPQKDLIDQGLHNPRVCCGTVHTFQGGEQDIILLSLVLGSEMAEGTKRWIASQRNLWNVAITRARHRLIVVGDRAEWTKQGGVGAMLGAAADRTNNEDNTDDLRRRLHRKIRAQGETATLGATIGGYQFDATLHRADAAVALLVDRGCGESDPVKHLRVLLRRVELTVRLGQLNARRVPAWRVLDDAPLTL